MVKVPKVKPRKASHASACETLEQLPNIGLSIAGDLRLVGILEPKDLIRADAFGLYQALCRATGRRHDPCVLDTFLAAVDFMGGAPAKPWWAYTPRRKQQFPAL